MNPKARLDRRFFVPDLSPQDRERLASRHPKVLFVAESPHIAEIEAEGEQERRPLCGKAGKAWWKKLGEILENQSSEDVSLERLLALCERFDFAVINAVQYPMDPKIASHRAEADPVANLGFAKIPGEFNYKKRRTNPRIDEALDRLRIRLEHPALSRAQIIPLGNDAEWFIQQILAQPESGGISPRISSKIPHPSAWWRRGGYFGRVAGERLVEVFRK